MLRITDYVFVTFRTLAWQCVSVLNNLLLFINILINSFTTIHEATLLVNIYFRYAGKDGPGRNDEIQPISASLLV